MSFSSTTTHRAIGRPGWATGHGASRDRLPGFFARVQDAAGEALVGSGWPAGLVQTAPIFLSPERATARGVLVVLVLWLAFTLLTAGAAALDRARRRAASNRSAATIASALLAALGLGAAWAVVPGVGLVAALVLAIEVVRRAQPTLSSGLDGLLLATALVLRLDATTAALGATLPLSVMLVVLLLGLFVAACARQGQLVLTLEADGTSASLLPGPWAGALPGLLLVLTTAAYVAFLTAVPELRAAHGALIFLTVPVVIGALERWRRITLGRPGAPEAGGPGVLDAWLVLMLALWALLTGMLAGPASLA